jgi:outer membrane usher protein FimD/PapC
MKNDMITVYTDFDLCITADDYYKIHLTNDQYDKLADNDHKWDCLIGETISAEVNRSFNLPSLNIDIVVPENLDIGGMIWKTYSKMAVEDKI